MTGRFQAVVFDLGGVVLDSPLEAIARYEREHELPSGAINRAVVSAGDGGAWPRLERGELTVPTFYAPFEADCRACGLEVSGQRLMACIDEAIAPRPRMLKAIARLREEGLRLGALTNNWIGEGGPRPSARLREHFDVFIESSVVGMRKPDPRMYELVCRELEVAPGEAVFLDDIGANLKSARALGMATIKVADADQALRELGELLGLKLLA